MPVPLTHLDLALLAFLAGAACARFLSRAIAALMDGRAWRCTYETLGVVGCVCLIYDLWRAW